MTPWVLVHLKRNLNFDILMSDWTSYFKSQQQQKDSANSKICSNTSISMHNEYANKNKNDYTKPLLLNKTYLQSLKNILRSPISIHDINSNKKSWSL